MSRRSPCGPFNSPTMHQSRRGGQLAMSGLGRGNSPPSSSSMNHSSRRDDRGIGCKVYIGNLTRSTDKDEIERAFSHYGKVHSVFIARNPPGFGFVEFDDPRDAQESVASLDGRKIGETHIRVQMAHGRRRGSAQRQLSQQTGQPIKHRHHNHRHVSPGGRRSSATRIRSTSRPRHIYVKRRRSSSSGDRHRRHHHKCHRCRHKRHRYRHSKRHRSWTYSTSPFASSSDEYTSCERGSSRSDESLERHHKRRRRDPSSTTDNMPQNSASGLRCKHGLKRKQRQKRHTEATTTTTQQQQQQKILLPVTTQTNRQYRRKKRTLSESSSTSGHSSNSSSSSSNSDVEVCKGGDAFRNAIDPADRHNDNPSNELVDKSNGSDSTRSSKLPSTNESGAEL
ncbi:hypothetical protein ACOME3_009210 [Neoechinorhynchus agilis]